MATHRRKRTFGVKVLYLVAAVLAALMEFKRRAPQAYRVAAAETWSELPRIILVSFAVACVVLALASLE